MTPSVILLRSHTDHALTMSRIRAWHEASPGSSIVFYDGSGGELRVRDASALNLVVYPEPRRQRYGYGVLFNAFRWIARQFPGAYCHYTEYDAVPLKRGYVEGLRLAKDTVLAGESHPESPGFRIWHEECRYRAVEVIGKVLNVPMSIAYGFGPSLILGADCVGYLGRFDEEDFERHIHPALERIKSDHVYDEVILMSLLVGRGFCREFNPAAKYIMCKTCDSATIERACRDPQAFAVHAVKSALEWDPIKTCDDACMGIGKLEEPWGNSHE